LLFHINIIFVSVNKDFTFDKNIGLNSNIKRKFKVYKSILEQTAAAAGKTAVCVYVNIIFCAI